MLIKNSYLEELKKLEKLEMHIKLSLKDAPAGKMRSEMSKGKYPQFYAISDDMNYDDTRGKYIKKSELQLAKAYAQKEYDEMMLEAIMDRKRKLKHIIQFQEGNGLDRVFTKLSSAKRSLISPYVISDDEYVKQWLAKGNDERNTYPVSNGFITERGELVRSKSEKMIADKLYMKGIPYKYESALHLNTSKIIFPDFTLLKLSTREEFYYEHFGMMDNADYCKSTLEKLETYENSNIILGDKLLVTFESSQKPINMKMVDSIIKRCID